MIREEEIILKKVIKKQADELKNRTEALLEMQKNRESIHIDIMTISAQNKKLQAMIETMKNERLKLLEEIEELKASSY